MSGLEKDETLMHRPATLRFTLFIFILLCPTHVSLGKDDSLHVSRFEEVRFRSQHFEIVGNLYLPLAGVPPHPLVIWVSGSGPSSRLVKNKETIKLVNCFLDGGFAYFRIDKPGSGDSRGKLNDDSVFAQLSAIVIDAIAKLKIHPMIDPGNIGLFGSSQAGYIMPKVISTCPDIAFMIGASCPGENSVEQWNYLLEHQLVCEGVPAERAKRMSRCSLACGPLQRERNSTKRQNILTDVRWWSNPLGTIRAFHNAHAAGDHGTLI